MSEPIKLAITGLGRIGRTLLRQIAVQGERSALRVVQLNDIAPLDMLAYLLRFDSVFGPFPGEVRTEEGALVINGQRIPSAQTPDLDVDLTGVDVLLDCTGKANTREWAERGLARGARQVLISGPSPVADVTLVLGANENKLGSSRIVSNASCTTNALAPLLKELDAAWGIEAAHMTTIHCYTGSQPMIDAPRNDMARSRAGALSMVPTTTSATTLIDEVLPHLAGRLSGAAVRVPTASISVVDIAFRLNTPPKDETEAPRQMLDASPVMAWTDWPHVASDLRAATEPVILALPQTQPRTAQHAHLLCE